jgi:microcystin degradation protein MlrC
MPRPTTLEDFRRLVIARGAEVEKQFVGTHHEIGGFFEGLAAEGIEAVPVFAARAVPSGTITAETLNALLGMMMEELGGAGKIDGLLVAPHGAGVSESQPDMDGYWLSLVRERVGPGMPIVCTLDPHANLTPRMVAACDATVAYRTNPHLDQRQRGIEAARLMGRQLRGEVRLAQAAAFPPVAINIERQLTSASPCRELYALADDILTRPGVLSDSVFLGFPYADVEEMGSAFVVVTNGDEGLARRYADELADYLWEHREAFVGELIGPEEAIERAMRSSRPACLLDMGDNVGGGSPGDGTVLAHALSRRGISAFVSLFDPESVAKAEGAGVGKRVTLEMGGKTDGLHGRPLVGEAEVVWVGDGRFTESQPRHGGNSKFDIGRTAVVRTATGLTVQLTGRRAMPSSLNQLLFCGLDPARFDIIVAKGVHAPVAAYAPVCPTLIRVNTPGITTADMGKLDYRKRRRPLFPFER